MIRISKHGVHALVEYTQDSDVFDVTKPFSRKRSVDNLNYNPKYVLSCVDVKLNTI